MIADAAQAALFAVPDDHHQLTLHPRAPGQAATGRCSCGRWSSIDHSHSDGVASEHAGHVHEEAPWTA